MAVELSRLRAAHLLLALSPVRRFHRMIPPSYDAQQSQKSTKRAYLSKHVFLKLLKQIHCKSSKTILLVNDGPNMPPLAVQSLAGISKRLGEEIQLWAQGLCTYMYQADSRLF